MRWRDVLRRDDAPVRGRRHAGAPPPLAGRARPSVPPVPPDLGPVGAGAVASAHRSTRTTAVGLVFADGAQVQLAPDDPRLRAFAAASAALLGR